MSRFSLFNYACRNTASQRTFTGYLLANTFMLSSTLLGAELLHMHGDGESSARFQLQRSCQIISSDADAHWCNPANLSRNSARLALAEMGVRADENGMGVANKAATRKPAKRDVETLFTKNNFSAISGYSRVETIVDNLSLSYTPFHVIAAYRINNPALPEIALIAVDQSTARLSSGIHAWQWMALDHQFTFDIGASVYWFERKTTRVEDQLINIAISQDSEIGERKIYSGIDSDVGIIVRNDHNWIPEIGFKVDRLNHAKNSGNDSRKISLAQYYERRSLASMGKSFSLDLGSIGIESSLPFEDAFQKADFFQASLGLQYSLGGLKAFVSAAPKFESFGFAFQGPYYLLGIQYTDEKQPNELQLKRQRMTYVYAKVQI